MDKFFTKSFDKKYFTYIYKNSDLKKFKKGAIIIREDDTDEVIYIILKGRVEVSKIMQNTEVKDNGK